MRALQPDAAVLRSLPSLLALHFALSLSDALFEQKKKLVEEALEGLSRLMTDGPTGERMKAAGSLPEEIRRILGLKGKTGSGTEG